MLIDIATGVDTCADRVDLHDDGEEQTKAKSKVILNTFTEGCLITMTHHMLMMHNTRSRYECSLEDTGMIFYLVP